MIDIQSECADTEKGTNEASKHNRGVTVPSRYRRDQTEKRHEHANGYGNALEHEPANREPDDRNPKRRGDSPGKDSDYATDEQHALRRLNPVGYDDDRCCEQAQTDTNADGRANRRTDENVTGKIADTTAD